MVLTFVGNLLNRLKWTQQMPGSEVVILHRGAPNNKKKINGDHITEIKKGSFSYMDTVTRNETYIPMHRVLEIWMGPKIVWKKRGNKPLKTKNTKQTKKTSIKTKKSNKKSSMKKSPRRKSAQRR